MDLKPKTFLRRVLDFARAELERRSSRPPSAAEESVPDMPHVPQDFPRDRPHAHTPHPPLCVLDVARTPEGVLHVAWQMSQNDVKRSEVLAGGEAVLCLRFVTFEPSRDDVRREVIDRPFVELSGTCDLGTADVRGVVSIGLRSGERFVSIAHHTV
jgi:hypothetical protein